MQLVRNYFETVKVLLYRKMSGIPWTYKKNNEDAVTELTTTSGVERVYAGVADRTVWHHQGVAPKCKKWLKQLEAT